MFENTNGEKTKSGFLNSIEILGNKIPHTLTLFIWMIVLMFIVTLFVSLAGITARDTITGEVIQVVNLVSKEGLLLLLTQFVANFSAFPILGVTLVVGVAMGLCEVSGFFSSTIQFCLSNAKSGFIAFFIAFFGVFMCSFDGAVSMVIVPTLAGTIYYAIGRNPIVGVISGFSAAATGAAMEFIPGFWQVTLTPLTVVYAQILDPNFTMPLMSDYFPVLAASIGAVLINVFVTVKIVEPRFQEFIPHEKIGHKLENGLTTAEIKAVKMSGLGILLFLLLLLLSCIPDNSFLRSAEGSLIVDAPLMSALENLLFLLFFIPGCIYAYMTKQMQSIKELADLLAEGLKSLLPFIVLSMIISQFIALFNYSNLGRLIAVKGGNALASMNMPSLLMILILFLTYLLLNVLIMSGSTKYLMFGSIVIPMMMQMNIHPAFTQMILRLADGTTNAISPMNAFFPIVVTLCTKYDKKCGLGSAMSALIPYCIGNALVFLAIIICWYLFELPTSFMGYTVWLHQ